MPNKKYTMLLDGEERQVSIDKFEKYGPDMYAERFSDAAIRMRNDKGEDFSVPAKDYQRAVDSGLRPFVTSYYKDKKEELEDRSGFVADSVAYLEESPDLDNANLHVEVPESIKSQYGSAQVDTTPSEYALPEGFRPQTEEERLFEENTRRFREGKPLKKVSTKEIMDAYPELQLKNAGYEPTDEEVKNRILSNRPSMFTNRTSSLMDKPLGGAARNSELIGDSLDKVNSRKDAAKRYYSSDEFKQRVKKETGERVMDLVSMTDKELKGIEEQIKSRKEALRNESWRPGMPSIRDDKGLEDLTGQRTLLRNAENILEDSRKIIDEAGKKDSSWFSSLGRGVADKVFDVDSWTMGITDMAGSMNLKNVLEKADKEEPLSSAEQRLLDAAVTNMAVNAYYSSDLSAAYKAGQVTGESIPFMLEMVVNPISASGNATAKLLLKYGLKKFGQQLGKNVGKTIGAAAGMTATTGVPGVIGGAYDRMNGQVKFKLNDKGQLTYDGRKGSMSAGEALAKSAASRFLENHSEMVFNAFNGMGDVVWRGVQKVVPEGVNGFIQKAASTGAGKMLRDWGNNELMKEVAKRTQFHGIAGEYLEEVYNNLANVPLGEMTMKQVTDLDRNIETFLGLAPTSVFFVILGLGSMTAERIQHRRKMDAAFGSMTDVQRKKFAVLEKLSKQNGNTDIRAFIKETMFDPNLTKEQKRQEIEYAYDIAVNNAFDEVAEEQTREQGESRASAQEEGASAYASGDPAAVRESVIREEVSRGRLEEVLPDVETMARLMAADDTGRAEILDGMPEEVRERAKDFLRDYDRRQSVEDAIDEAHAPEVEEAESLVAKMTHNGRVTIIPLGRFGDVSHSHGVIINGLDENGNSTINGGLVMVVPLENGSDGPDFSSFDVARAEAIALDHSFERQEMEPDVVVEALLGSYKADVDNLSQKPVVPGQTYTIFDGYGNPVSMQVLDQDGQGNWNILMEGQKTPLAMPEDRVLELLSDAERAPIVAEYEAKDTAKQEEKSAAKKEIMSDEFSPEVMALKPELNEDITIGGLRAQVADINPDGITVRYVTENGSVSGSGQISMEDYYAYKQSLFDKQKEQAKAEEDGNAPVHSGDSAEEMNGSRPMTEDEAASFIFDMERNAVEAPEMELTPENWISEFGEDGLVETPIGQVKFGKHQYAKLQRQGRNSKLGMIKPTLISPDVIIEDASKSKGANAVERGSSYIFVKAFKGKDGKRMYYFTSVTVQQDGAEVVISNQEKSLKRISNLLQNGTINWINENVQSASETQNGKSVSLGDSRTVTQADNNTAPLGINSPELSTVKDNGKNGQLQENNQKPLHEREKDEIFRELGDKYGEKMPHKVEVTAKALAGDMARLQTKLVKAQEDFDNAPIGREDKAEKALKKVRQEYDELKREADFWAALDGEIKEAQKAREGLLNPETSEILDEQPLSADEFIAQQLSYGNIVLDPASFMNETGYGSKEKQELMGGSEKLFKPGGMSIESAGERLMEMDREEGTNFFDQTDANAGRDALIDFLGSVRSRKDINNYIKNKRRLQQERESEGLKDQIAAEIWENYHMSVEDYLTFEEIIAQEVKERTLSDEEYQEYMSTFVDEQNRNKYGNQGTSEEFGGQAERIEQGGILAEGEGSVEILPDTQPVQARGNSGAAEESAKTDGNLDGENGDVPTGASGNEVNSQIESARLQVAQNPSEAQKEAGNYRKGHVRIDGFDITIENPKGGVRSGTDERGKKWSVTMNNDYGYIRGTEAVDGDHIDIFLSDTPSEGRVFVVDQLKKDGTFDESKVMYGFSSLEEARSAYLSNYDKGWESRIMAITEVSKEDFKKWIQSSHRKTKAFCEYKNMKGHTYGPSIESSNVSRIQDIENRLAEIEDRKIEISDLKEDPYIGRIDLANLLVEEQALDAEQLELEAEYSGLRAMNEESNAISEAEGSDLRFRKSDEEEEERRKPLRVRAKEWEKKVGVKVNLMESIEDVTNKDARKAIQSGAVVTGWFEESTGEVCLFMPYLDSVEEIDATYIHEVVAHKGLRGLLGNEFDSFCDEVWESMSEADQIKFLNYPGVNGNSRAAADEYVAHLAENVDVSDSVWSKFTEIFKKFLKAVGLEPKMTDADIANTIKKSYQRLLEGEVGADVAGDGTRFNAKRTSDRRQEINRINSTVDQAISFVTGKDIKDVKAERVKKELKRKEDAAEIYQSVLSGDFNDVTLQKINDYIDDATPLHPYGRRISQRLPQKMERDLHEGARTNAVDALFSRICESAVPASRRASEAGRREIEERKKEALKGWAIATNNWHTDLSDFADEADFIRQGTDSKVYLAKDGNHVIKVSFGKPGGKRFRPDIDTTALFNSVFRNTAYEIVGYGEFDGKFARILKQPFVDFADKTALNADEREEYMRTLGFEPINESKTAFSNGSIVAADLQKSNILKDAAGNISVIDADMKLHTKDVGGNYTYPPVEADVPGGTRFRTVYHGSGASFDKFDHSFMGTGEGNQSFGWGTYVTDVKGIGKQYAEVMGKQPEFTYKEMSSSEAYKKYPELQYLAFFMDRGDSAEKAIERRRNILNKVINTEGVNFFRKEMAEKSLEVLDSLEPEEMKITKNRHLYEVEIPDNDGTNYLSWEEPLTDEQKKRIKDVLLNTDEYKSYSDKYGNEMSEERVDSWLSAKGGAGRVYRFLENFFEDSPNSAKSVRELLSKAGFIGMEYPANFYGGGNSHGDNNYVIFNEHDLDIVEHTRFRAVTDKKLIDKLESEPKIKVYRAMQLVDGKLYPPMSAKVDGKMRESIELGKWEMAEERPDLADDKGYFKLDKGNKKSLKARYNPYIHTSTTPLNDQFSSAQTRPELVTVEVEVPESELTSGYKAEKAKDAVGKLEWKAGVVQGKLSGTRTVILSRYDKPVRIVPDSEVAAEIVKMFDGRDITMPSNVVTPSLRAELEKLGVPFVETDNRGKEVGGTRFKVVKDKNELVAVHNISEDNLRKVLSMGGLIMPSIAITKADMGHEGYGDISLLFDKETINPSDRRNKVYGGDAWTPRFPHLEAKLNDKVIRNVVAKIRGLIDDKLREEYHLSAELYPDNIERTLSSYGVEGYYSKEYMKLAYLLDSGKKVKIPMKMKDYGEMSELILGMAKEKGVKVSEIQQGGIDFFDNNPEFVNAVHEAETKQFIESLPENKREAASKMIKRDMAFNHFDTLISKAARMEYDLEHGGLKKLVDKNALSETINKKVKTDNADYNKWVNGLFEGIVEKYGIRNNRDMFTPSGNSRPWEQLHDAATPSNILKYMLAENEQGGSGGFFDSNIMGASAETYKSIEEIREKGKKRLRRLEEGEFEEWSDSVAERMSEICNDFLSPSQRKEFGAAIDAKIDITNAVAKDKTANGIYKTMKRDYPGFKMEHAKQVESIVKEIQDFAIGYFEAKPRRIVPLSEVMKAIVPTKTSSDILDALKDNGIEVATYRRGNEEARAKLIKKESNGIRFRISNQNQEIFVSNAAKAVEGIKQEKGTPQQWLAMIEKNGGLKAGEDKWLGLSDWLKGLDKKSVTKAEILDFINVNKIQIEEVHYGGEDMTAEDIKKTPDYKSLVEDLSEYNNDGNPYISEEKYNYLVKETVDFKLGFKLVDGKLEIKNPYAAMMYLDIAPKVINGTRLGYTTKGLHDNHEIALTVPTIEPYNQDDDIHFGDAGEGRAVAWIRFGETTVPQAEYDRAAREADDALTAYQNELAGKYMEDGGSGDPTEYLDMMSEEEIKHMRELSGRMIDAEDQANANQSKVLVIDEIQSKRHQDGRERGYYESISSKKVDEDRKYLSSKYSQGWNPSVITKEEYAELERLYTEAYNEKKNAEGKVPAGPFDKNWHELAMKRMLRYAAENGFDKVAWTTGAQQAERYNIGNIIKRIERDKDGILVRTSGYDLSLDFNEEGVITNGDYEGRSLAEVLGKDMSVKVMSLKEGESVEGDGLHIGGEGMKGFYDKMLPSFVQKYTKKWGAKVGMIELPEIGQTMHSVDVTDAMKASVMEGQTMFRTVYHGSSADFDKFDHSFMGSGEGNQTFGWGTYVTEVEGIAKSYANNMSLINPREDIKYVGGEDVSSKTLNKARRYLIDGGLNLEDAKTWARIDLNVTIRKNEKDAIKFLLDSNEADWEITKKRHLYEVEIPDNNGANYLEWNQSINENIVRRVVKSLLNNGAEEIESRNGFPTFEKNGRSAVINPAATGADLYAELEDLERSDKNASMILSDAGFVGIEYPAEAMSGGRADGAKNYVIFNEKDLKIKNNVKFRVKDIQSEVDSFTSKYNSKPVVVVDSKMNDKALEEAFEGFVPLDEVKELFKGGAKAGYVRNNGKIYIFADNEAPEEIEESLFHENLHAYIADYGDLVGELWSGSDNEKLKNRVKKHYAEDKWKEEFFVITIADAQKKGDFSEVMKFIPENKHSGLIESLNKFGYDYEQESEQRKQGRVSKETGGQGGRIRTSGDYVQDKDGRSSEKKKRATEVRRLFDQVANNGLRGVVGDEAYISLIQDLYNALPKDIRVQIKDKSQKNYSGDYILATSEYLASTEKVGVWDKIVGFVRDYLRRAGFDLDLTEGDVRYLFWRSRKPLNPYSVIDKAEDIHKQVTLKAGEYVDRSSRVRFREKRPAIVKRYDDAVDNNSFRFQEAFQDSMLSLKVLMETIEDATGKKAKSFEDAYTAENRLSSINKIDNEKYLDEFFAPLMAEIKKLSDKHGQKAVEDYIYAKSGLERNEVLKKRDADKAYAESMEELDEKLRKGDLSDDQYDALKSNVEIARSEAMASDNDYAGLRGLLFNSKVYELDEKLRVGEISESEYNRMYNELEKKSDEVEKDFKAYAETLVSDFESSAGDEAVSALWKRINAATNETLRKDYDSGMMDKETYEATKNMMEYYVPLRGWSEKTAEEVYDYRHTTAPIQRNQKTAKGRRSQADNPIASIAQMAQNAIVRGNRNKMKQRLFNFVVNRPTALATFQEGWYVMDNATGDFVVEYPVIEEGDTAEEIQRKMEEFEKRMQELSKDRKAFKGKLPFGSPYRIQSKQKNEHLVPVMINGREYGIYINGNPRAAQAVNGMTNPESVNWLSEMYEKSKRFYSAGLTSWNPDFLVANTVRDSIYSTTMTFLDKGPLVAARFLRDIPKSLNTIRAEIFGKGAADPQMHQYFEEFVRYGGETGYTAVQTLEDYKKEYERILKNLEGIDKGFQFVKDGFSSVAKWMEQVNRMSEDINRFNAYQSARKSGLGVEESVDAAKNITVNFNKKGALGTTKGIWGSLAWFMNKWMLFFNPTVQGITQIYKSAKANPKRFNALLGTVIGSGVLIPFLNSMVVAMFGGDEEDYWLQNDYNRMNNMLLKNPLGKGYFKIPLPPTFREIYGIGDIFYRLMTGRITSERAAVATLRQLQLLTGFLNVIPDDEPDLGKALVGLAPDMLAPLTNIMINQDFTGRKIAKVTDYNKHDPEYQRVYKGVSPFYVELSRYINKMGGDDISRAPLYGTFINPAYMEHIITGYTGGIGKTLSNVAGFAADAVSGSFNENFDLRKVPLVNRFYSVSDESTERSAANRRYRDYQSRYEKLNHDYKKYKEAVRNGKTEYAEEVERMENNGEKEFVEFFKKKQRVLNKKLDLLKKNPEDKNLEQEITDLKMEISLKCYDLLKQ